MQDSGHGVETILVCVDGPANSIDAVRWVAGRAPALGAEVVAVHALGMLDRLEPDGPLVPTQPHRDEIAEKVRTQWITPLDEAGVTHRCLLHDGNPVEVVLR